MVGQHTAVECIATTRAHSGAALLMVTALPPPSSSADASSSDAPALTVEDVADAIAANSWAGCSDGSDEETAETEE